MNTITRFMTFATFAIAAFSTGCDSDDTFTDPAEQTERSSEQICEVTEWTAAGEMAETNCFKPGEQVCEDALLCCDYNTGGCFCSDNAVRCPPGSKKAPCPEGTSC